MGTAELARASLSALLASPKLQVLAVVTQPDRPQGRSLQIQAPPVKRLALAASLPVLQPDRARDPAFLTQLATFQPDLIVVAAYGQILPAAVLNLAPHGCLNVHTSLLPRHRGAAPIQWAILNGDSETGVTIMRITQQLDAGDILAQRAVPIPPDETAGHLHDRLAILGADLLLDTLFPYLEGRLQPKPQSHEGVTYARKITKEDGRIDWQLPASELYNRLRAFTPWPGSFTHFPAAPQPRLVKIWQASVAADQSGPPGTVIRVGPDLLQVACGKQSLNLLSLQPEGRRRMSTREFIAGHPIHPGQALT